jgi:hypothetical protein
MMAIEEVFRIAGEFSIASEIRNTRQQNERGALFFGQTAVFVVPPSSPFPR